MNIKTIDFPPEIENASCLGANVKRADLICAIANELNIITSSEHPDFIDYYRSHSMIIGEKINFIKASKVTPATAISIDEKGGLEVELEDGTRTILRSGEISIRKR
jgi:BirA family biotin operon repressor/biotin-[acetyl-CoA-carboxylase] ligase